MNGAILYRGPSLLDGAPIVVLAIGFRGSENRKTGDMIQTYILADNGQTPLDNAKHGKDASICGECIHRGQDGKLGSCYVNLGRGPNAVWTAYQNGKYPVLTDYRVFAGKAIRFGTYGDPAAAPLELWAKLARLARHHTGYTHQWRTCPIGYARYLMASVETEEQMHEAKRMGYRTYRTRLAHEPVSPSEIICPASDEGGHRRTCSDCRACRGAGTGHGVVIILHGLSWKTQRYAYAKRIALI